ncbi:hypothetical protein [Clostridium tetani]|uniref:hypothetical protein n=1 Tax=Clostridium tetani TaxID=1513 RepID=UPI00100A3681|nr:hypothetical protein [Clostridium tetani]RXM70332.1 hypothetical protein DP139_06490 [Clostridium tetani]
MKNEYKENLGKILKNYKEFTRGEREQLEEIVSTESIKPIERKRIIKKIILGERYGQDLTEKEILKNLNDKEKIRYLLNRLFIEDIEIGAEIKFIERVKDGRINIKKFLDLHKKYPRLNYWQKISLNY